MSRLAQRPGARTTAFGALLALGLFLGGCAELDLARDAARPSGTASEASPALPPGDPGPDAPAAADPGTAGAEPHAHDEARRTVPVGAMLSVADVQAMVGGRWQRRPGGGDECVVPTGAVALRSASYGGASAGLLVQTVASYPDPEAADAAVAGLGRTAARCGWDRLRDPRLGSASVAADQGPRALTAVAAEGVLVLLVGRGAVARDAAGWGSLVDLALGSSCPAAPDGCH